MSKTTDHEVFLGVDVGSVSTNFVLIDPKQSQDAGVIWKKYLRTQGAPLKALQEGLKALKSSANWGILGVGVTGSGRNLAGQLLKADVIKNEITAHAIGALKIDPSVRTIIEIGGQDSKLIVLQDQIVVDFAMNTMCAAGTGSFLDQQAGRLNIPIAEFGQLALQSKNPVRIAGRCTVFAESDLIHKQQLGHSMEDLLAGLCVAMIRNYLSNVVKGKKLHAKIFFQGGVAANVGMQRFLSEALEQAVFVPKHYDVMGALGVAHLALEKIQKAQTISKFVGFELFENDFKTKSYLCSDCPNHCEIVEVWQKSTLLATWGSRCDRSY